MNAEYRRATSIAIGGMIALAAGMGIGRFVYTPVLPFMEAALGLTKPQAGIIASINFLGYLLGALAAALIGWDAGLIAPQVSSASTKDRRRFALGYTLRTLAVVCLGILLVAAAGTIRVSLTFSSGLGLSFAVLVLAAFFLQTLRRAEASDNDARPDHK